MCEKLNLSDFDILGVIMLQDVNGIEKYVTPVIEKGKKVGYLSRSREYYNVKTMTELLSSREELKTKLTTKLSKRNFVILENMLNCSAKVYFKKFEEYIRENKDPRLLEQVQRAKECFDEDMENILHILEGNGEIYSDPLKALPAGDENSEKRAIEMDNKGILYIVAKSMKITKSPNTVQVLNPGYGSLDIGPMLKAMYGFDYTNLLKNRYIEETMCLEDAPLRATASNDEIFNPKKTLLLIDDNIGTGLTMREVKEKLKSEGIDNFMSGAVQFNWRNYYRISVGDKKDIPRFEINNFDFVSPLNYAGHKLYKHAIDFYILLEKIIVSI